MSADNYHYILKYPNGKYAVLRNLSASADYTTKELWEADPHVQEVSLDKVLLAAHRLNRAEPTEYGVVLAREVDDDL